LLLGVLKLIVQGGGEFAQMNKLKAFELALRSAECVVVCHRCLWFGWSMEER
jgi:hypothetical protein